MLPTEPDPAPTPGSSPDRVLVLDDEGLVKAALTEDPHADRFVPTFTATTIEAVAHLLEADPTYDAAIIDIRVNGKLVPRTVLAELTNRRIATILFTAVDPSLAGPIAAEHRVARYLAKPAPPEAIVSALLFAVTRTQQLADWSRGESGRQADLLPPAPPLRAHSRSTSSVYFERGLIRDARLARAWNQEELAHRSGTCDKTVRAAEKGNLINAKKAKDIAQAVGVDYESAKRTPR